MRFFSFGGSKIIKTCRFKVSNNPHAKKLSPQTMPKIEIYMSFLKKRAVIVQLQGIIARSLISCALPRCIVVCCFPFCFLLRYPQPLENVSSTRRNLRAQISNALPARAQFAIFLCSYTYNKTKKLDNMHLRASISIVA